MPAAIRPAVLALVVLATSGCLPAAGRPAPVVVAPSAPPDQRSQGGSSAGEAPSGDAAAPTGAGAAPDADAPLPTLDLSTIPGAEAAAREVSLDGDTLRDALLSAISGATLALPSEVAALRADPARRLRVVTTLGPLLPRIVASPSFRAAYSAVRTRAIAVPPVEQPKPPRTAKEIQDERVAVVAASVAETEKQAADASLPSEARAALRQVAAEQRRMLTELRAATGEAEALAAADRERFEIERRALPERAKAREADAARLRAEWPDDAGRAIAKRLDDFLALTASMPWNAKLVTRGDGKRVFVDPALEAKSPDWKLCFRAGKPTVDTARGLAERWLAELRGQ